MRSFLRKAGIVHDPSRHRSVPGHRPENMLPRAFQNRFVAPRRIRYQMVQGLVRPPDIIGSQALGHRLDALALTRQQQSGAVSLHRRVAIHMPRGFRQAICVCRNALFLWAWRGRFSHKNILHQFRPL